MDEFKYFIRGIVSVHLLVEDQETLQDLEFVLVGYSATDLVVKVSIIQRLHGLQTLVRQRWPIQMI